VAVIDRIMELLRELRGDDAVERILQHSPPDASRQA
jgi:hypothetical protein